MSISSSVFEYNIETSQRYELVSDQISTINITVKDTLDIDIVGLTDSKGTFLINVYGSGQLNLNLHFSPYSQWNFLYMNRSDEHLSVNEMVTLEAHTTISANYGELTNGKHDKVSAFRLIGEFSHLDVQGASIAFNELKWKFDVVHIAKDSYAMVKNHAVVFKGGTLGLEVLGTIEHGYHRSKTHQETRVINLDEGVKAIVNPKLIINENDVEASHAASVGQPDPEAVYYLQSRGLTYAKTMEMITLGYLMPIVDVIENESIREELTQTIQTKVIG